MPSKKHRPEEIIGKLRKGEVALAHGSTTAEACRRIGVTEQTYYIDARQCVWPGISRDTEAVLVSPT